MNEENTKYLREHFPNLYKEYGGDPTKTCMAWGITCGDGWFEIIKELSEKLEPLGIVAAQVKEKFGGLRFYVDGTTNENWEEVHKYIDEAEIKSYETCENCGQPGKPNGRGWIRTLCDNCRKKD
jgi:hypothetical protein